MRKEYDFSKARRGAVIASSGQTSTTLMLDDDVIEFFRTHAEAAGTGYQAAINAALRKAMSEMAGTVTAPLTVERLRQVLREELRAA